MNSISTPGYQISNFPSDPTLFLAYSCFAETNCPLDVYNFTKPYTLASYNQYTPSTNGDLRNNTIGSNKVFRFFEYDATNFKASSYDFKFANPGSSIKEVSFVGLRANYAPKIVVNVENSDFCLFILYESASNNKIVIYKVDFPDKTYNFSSNPDDYGLDVKDGDSIFSSSIIAFGSTKIYAVDVSRDKTLLLASYFIQLSGSLELQIFVNIK